MSKVKLKEWKLHLRIVTLEAKMFDLTWVFIFLAGLGLLGVLMAAIRIVPEYKRMVVLRLGKSIGARGPGLVLLIPFVDRPIWQDLREFVVNVPPQTCITKDNAPVSIDFLIYLKVIDAVQSVIEVEKFRDAAQGIAMTTLRAVVGDLSLDDVLAKRDQINQVLRVKMDEVTARWGIKVTMVEIREIQPPRDVQDAMTRQMAAERIRRATVIEADGKREAAIKVAEGEKQAAILKAEGGRQAQLLTAEGYGLALEKIEAAANTIGSKTMSLQYLDALRTLGAGPATKFVLPMEFTALLRPLVDHVERGGELNT
ncbi:MAG TPA: SPFH domain-containing protein [Anaerolineales bacterium]|nr:SPFH domain-containing protein [Anaerolineales bacterium]